MRQVGQVLAVLLCCAAPAFAEAPDSSIRPLARPVLGAPEMTLSTQASLLAGPMVSPAPPPTMRPRARPEGLGADVAGADPDSGDTAAAPRRGFLARLRPAPRPEGGAEQVEQAAAVRILPGRSAVTSRKGSVCGVPGIKGEDLADITSRVRGCGIEDPVRVTSVDGVKLSMAATIDCDTARALNDWVKDGLKPAFGRKDVVGLRIAGHYVCRSRNNVRGAPISEHGRGKAIDIAGIVLANGTTVTVLGDWRSSAGKPMVKAYKAACGPFGTTLGPNSDRYHRDHMHFDTASQRNGPYCR